LGNPAADRRIILTVTLRNLGVHMWIGFSWLKIGTSDEMLWTRFSKRRGISWSAELLNKDWPCCMGVSQPVNHIRHAANGVSSAVIYKQVFRVG
jgi:hypothetical protein